MLIETWPIDKPTEEWCRVVDFPAYEVSSLGRVRRGNRILRTSPSGKGYLSLTLSVEGQHFRRYVHRLVCRAFRGPAPTTQHEAAHQNGVKTDNAARNLQWATHGENEKQKISHGTSTVRLLWRRGERHHGARLSAAVVAEIRAIPYRRGLFTQLARKYHVSRAAIGRAFLGESWK